METIDINQFIELLKSAKEKGCTKVKLQIYDNWEDIVREQKCPTHKLEDYLIDTRYYNTMEFETEIVNATSTDKIITMISKDTLIIRVSISDRNSLLHNLGITDFFN